MNLYYMAGAVLESRDTTVNKTDLRDMRAGSTEFAFPAKSQKPRIRAERCPAVNTEALRAFLDLEEFQRGRR